MEEDIIKVIDRLLPAPEETMNQSELSLEEFFV